MAEHRHNSNLIPHTHRPPDAKVRQVIEVRFVRGEGCCKDDPMRNVTAYFDLDGTFLAEFDRAPTRTTNDKDG